MSGKDTRAALIDALRDAQGALVAVHEAIEVHNAAGVSAHRVSGERLLGYVTDRVKLALYRPKWYAVESRRIGKGTQATANDAALLAEVEAPASS